ncbi:MAG: ParA family protein [Porticoccaceae bacterium]|nr:ParA family protein [Porticoccaceae bacterium]
MTPTYAIANQKGGVGKTTTSVNLSASLAHLGKRVLLIDMDPQGNATTGSGVDKNSVKSTVSEVLCQEKDIKANIIKKLPAGYDLLPANGDLTVAEVYLINNPGGEKNLHKAIESLDDYYDVIIIDCPPALNMLTVNSLAACNSVIIPMQCEYYALEGLSALVGTIAKISKTVNRQLRVEGILRTMYDPRNSLTNEVSNQLHEYFGNRVYQTVIPRNVRLAEAPSYGQPALLYDRYSKGAVAYLGMAEELIRRATKARSTT